MGKLFEILKYLTVSNASISPFDYMLLYPQGSQSFRATIILRYGCYDLRFSVEGLTCHMSNPFNLKTPVPAPMLNKLPRYL